LTSASPPLPRDLGVGAIVAWKLVRGTVLGVLAAVLIVTFPSGGAVRLATAAASWLAREFSSSALRDAATWLTAHINPGTVGATTLVLTGDAAVQLVQGIGLAYRRRWAAWATVVMTALLIPVEIWHLISAPRWPRVLILAGNVLIVGYLVRRVRKRLELWSK
jgi:uncharacterized membrane protein (DUF2068 family)